MSHVNKHYRAFISYSHKDAKWATWLHRSLERYAVPIDAYPSGEKLDPEAAKRRRSLSPVFRDRDELPASGSLTDTIQEALEASENLIVLCSPNSAASQYVNAEIEIFRGLHPKNDQKVYALIIEGEPPACFPEALTAGGAEPIAADAREHGDGKADAKLKLIAGLLGVGF
ncbi:MAG: toll/interleukin-1 receptor domain-containing protein, partial [Verrucomicrobia bacterium]|nr:toll/interleukin-1 receptor domain-containing protein [Verrucomicrobiota bacterium]